MRKLRFSFRTELRLDQPVTDHYYTLRCIPSSDGVQQLYSVNCRVAPGGNIRYNRDGFHNRTGTGCIQEAHQYFSFDVEGLAFVTGGYRKLDETDGSNAVFRYPTPLTMPDQNMKEFLNRLGIGREDGLKGLIRLNREISAYMAYRPGVTGVRTTAGEAFLGRAGVCQDDAHIFLALARELGYPARYVSGLMLGEGATHAWAEAALDGCWIGFDPANCRMADDTYIHLAHGRDYGDCPVERGVFRGKAAQCQQVTVTVQDIT